MENREKKPVAALKKKFEGTVVSDKMEKTIVVLVERVKIHPKYHKRYTRSRKYKVHDEKKLYKEGDRVQFVECRPISRDKRWRAIYKTDRMTPAKA